MGLPVMWSAAGVSAAVALWSGIADWRRRKRVDLDRVGWVNWPTVQVLALMALAILVSVALNS